MLGSLLGIRWCVEADCALRFERKLWFEERNETAAARSSRCAECSSLLTEKRTEHIFQCSSSSFREVRVEYRYNNLEDRFLGLAVVSEDHQIEGDTYIIRCPILHCEKKAAKLAETVLANLLLGRNENVHEEFLLDLSSQNFSSKLDELAKLLEKSELVVL